MKNDDAPRAALIARCAQQRLPMRPMKSRALVGATVSTGIGLKVPLAIAGVMLGIIATRSAGRAMPLLLTAGLSVWKLAKNLLAHASPQLKSHATLKNRRYRLRGTTVLGFAGCLSRRRPAVRRVRGHAAMPP